MTRLDRDYDDILSRVLHSTLDPIEPAGDGLAKIQKRIAEPWLKRRMSLLRTELMALGWLIAVRCEPFFSAARSSLAGIARPGSRRQPQVTDGLTRIATAQAAARSGRHAGTGRGRASGSHGWVGPTAAWLRPTLAVGAAVVIVVAGAFALGHFNAGYSPASDSNVNGNSHSHHRSGTGKGGGSGGPQTSGATPGQHSGSNHTAKASNKRGPAASSSCAPSASPTVQSTSPAQATPTPTPATSVSPSPTPDPTPTISPTAPADPASGGSAATTDAVTVQLPARALLSSCSTAGREPG